MNTQEEILRLQNEVETAKQCANYELAFLLLEKIDILEEQNESRPTEMENRTMSAL